MVMRKGGKHNWSYKGHWFERKVAPGKWVIKFTATKGQKPRYGVSPGSRFKWRINATQRAVKTGAGRYQTVMTGVKRLSRASVKKRRR